MYNKTRAYLSVYFTQRLDIIRIKKIGEPVFWSSRGGSQPNKFSHYNKTEQTPECDKRVDGRSGLNLYERVGLPVYLAIRAGNQFSLMIGFPAVGEQLLAMAASRDIKVCVTGAEHYRKVSVNAVNFLEDDVTLLPINFIPYPGKNFGVTFESEETFELRKKWSDYADGFGCGGAIFTYGETGGKKIRKGGNISSDKQYYVIARKFAPPQEISSQKCKKLSAKTVWCMAVADIAGIDSAVAAHGRTGGYDTCQKQCKGVLFSIQWK